MSASPSVCREVKHLTTKIPTGCKKGKKTVLQPALGSVTLLLSSRLLPNLGVEPTAGRTLVFINFLNIVSSFSLENWLSVELLFPRDVHLIYLYFKTKHNDKLGMTRGN